MLISTTGQAGEQRELSMHGVEGLESVSESEETVGDVVGEGNPLSFDKRQIR